MHESSVPVGCKGVVFVVDRCLVLSVYGFVDGNQKSGYHLLRLQYYRCMVWLPNFAFENTIEGSETEGLQAKTSRYNMYDLRMTWKTRGK